MIHVPGLLLLVIGLLTQSVSVLWLGVALLLLSVLVLVVHSLIQATRSWKRRQIDSLSVAVHHNSSYDRLAANLLHFPASSLQLAADELRDREAVVGRRASLFVGAARVGGVLGWASLVILSGAGLNKALTETPTLTGNQRDVVWFVFSLVMAGGLGALLATHGQSTLLRYADLLHRLAAAQKQLTEEASSEEAL
ncbi:hypothetical protein ACFFLM_24005 [Deinococcus oregonensis]|uniref:MotA/TolQ/ExbB proton channel domain-containing protein n=1 Tax=Deinococcus oregonensis TaxID=1805970 RepID=A0ABV6B707_9DEIO